MKNPEPEKPFFQSDSRLKTQFRSSSSQESFRLLSDKLKKLTATRINLGNGLISYSCKNSPIWELMESISAIEITLWKQEGSGYRLLEPLWFLDYGYGAHDEYMLRRFEAGMAFINGLQKMPKSLQDKIFVPDGSYPGIKFNDLPKNLQLNIIQSNQARTAEEKSKGRSYLLSSANPANFSISVEQNKNNNGIGDYSININSSSPSVSSGFRVTDYHTRPGNKPSGVFGKLGFSRSVNSLSNFIENGAKKYIPKKTNCDQKLKIKEKMFEQEVTLLSERVTLHRALFLISEKIDLNYVCAYGGPKAKTATVNLRGATLLESLEYLERAFPGAKWTVRDSGFIVFRAPDNPVDYPEKNPYIKSGSR
jgi:hypothetical protein